MAQQVDKQMLKKMLAGQCNTQETDYINRYLTTPEGKAMLNELLEESWEESATFEMPETEVDRLATELTTHIANNTAKAKAANMRTIITRCAAVLLAAICAWAAIRQVQTKPQPQIVQMIEKVNPYGKRSSFMLDDSTMIYLGAGSRLRYPVSFKGNIREVSLYGEAYFEVKHDVTKPFIIKTGAVNTRVLGTTFKITAFKNHALKVAVTSGKVSVGRNKAKPLAILTPGRQLEYTEGTPPTVTNISVDGVARWKQGTLVFNHTPLNDLMEEVGRWYGLNIRFKNKTLAKIPVTVTLDANVPVNRLMNALEGIIALHYQIKGTQLIIY